MTIVKQAAENAGDGEAQVFGWRASDTATRIMRSAVPGPLHGTLHRLLAIARLPLIQSVFVDPLRADRPVVLLPLRFTADPRPDDSNHEDDTTDDDTEPACPRHAGDRR